MKRYIKTASISFTAALLIIGTVFGFVAALYNAGEAGTKGEINSPFMMGTPVDGGTSPLGEVVENEENKYTGFDVVFDEVQYPSKLLLSLPSNKNNNQQLVKPVTPEPEPLPPVDDDYDIPVYRPIDTPDLDISISNIAGIIKGRDYHSGINIFQGDGKKISGDTEALEKAIKKGSNECSFIAIRLSDGASIAYNVREQYRCASTYKAMVSLYIYKMAEAGNLSLDETMTYKRSDYYSGSGIIKSYSTGTKFTLRQLADYSVRYSDNIAFVMLQRYIDDNSLMSFAKALGCENYSNMQFTWPEISALDASLWWAEIYKFSKSGKLGAQLYNIFLNATHTIIEDALGGEHDVAHKSGSVSRYYHDCGIVESEDPYILIMLSHNPRNYSSKNASYVNPIIREIDKLINP